MYYLSLFPILIGVANQLEKLQRDFLWKDIGDEFNFHMVKWSNICSSIILEDLREKYDSVEPSPFG
jgi:hypothetical protein